MSNAPRYRTPHACLQKMFKVITFWLLFVSATNLGRTLAQTPTAIPTLLPTNRPLSSPTLHPTTASPTESPTRYPTFAPSKHPTTSAPTKNPTKQPTNGPTKNPTKHPSFAPTKTPTKKPTFSPTISPTKKPTFAPTKSPTKKPTFAPTKSPTKKPTFDPTKSPTHFPTRNPTRSPTTSPTHFPTRNPTLSPTFSPTKFPTRFPTRSPSSFPTDAPSFSPTYGPTFSPTSSPSLSPSFSPTSSPTETPFPSTIVGSTVAAIAGCSGISLLIYTLYKRRSINNGNSIHISYDGRVISEQKFPPPLNKSNVKQNNNNNMRGGPRNLSDTQSDLRSLELDRIASPALQAQPLVLRFPTDISAETSRADSALNDSSNNIKLEESNMTRKGSRNERIRKFAMQMPSPRLKMPNFFGQKDIVILPSDSNANGRNRFFAAGSPPPNGKRNFNNMRQPSGLGPSGMLRFSIGRMSAFSGGRRSVNRKGSSRPSLHSANNDDINNDDNFSQIDEAQHIDAIRDFEKFTKQLSSDEEDGHEAMTPGERQGSAFSSKMSLSELEHLDPVDGMVIPKHKFATSPSATVPPPPQDRKSTARLAYGKKPPVQMEFDMTKRKTKMSSSQLEAHRNSLSASIKSTFGKVANKVAKSRTRQLDRLSLNNGHMEEVDGVTKKRKIVRDSRIKSVLGSKEPSQI